MEQEKITLEYALTIDDLVAFQQFAVKRIMLKLVLPPTALIIAAALILGFLAANDGTNTRVLLFEYFLIALSLVGFGVSFYYPRQVTVASSIFIVLWLALGIYNHTVLSSLSFVPLVIISGFSSVFLRMYYKQLYAGKTDVTGKRTMIIDENKIHEIAAESEDSYKWSLISEVVADDKYIYIFIGKLKGYIVPKTCFADANAADQFMGKVKEFKSGSEK